MGDTFDGILKWMSKVIHWIDTPFIKKASVIVPDDKLSLAIGKGGVNVRLAARLTNWKIDVTSESKANKQTKEQSTVANVEDLDDLFGDINLD